MIEWFILALLFVASIIDYITREIPDTISFSLISLAILDKLLLAFQTNNINIFLYAIIFGIVFYVFAYALAYFNLWGGADSKFLIAMGIYFSNFDLILDFSINFLMAAFVFSCSYLILKSMFNYSRIKTESQALFYDKVNLIMFIFLLLVTIIPMQLIFKIIIYLHLFLIFLYYNRYLILKIESLLFVKTVQPNDLTEGDWLIKSITVKGKKIENMPMGLDKKTISFIGKNYAKKIDIKWGIPFIPVFLLAFLATQYLSVNTMMLLLNILL